MNVKFVGRSPIAVRLLCAVFVPLVALGGLLAAQFIQARSVTRAAASNLVEIEVLAVMTELQSRVEYPESIAAGLVVRSPESTGFVQRAVVDRYWVDRRERIVQAIAAYEAAIRQHPGVLPTATERAFAAEIATLRQLSGRPPESLTRNRLQSLRELRARTDALMTDFAVSLSTGAWVIFQERLDVERTSAMEFTTALATLAGLERADPSVLSSLAGAQRNAVVRIGLGADREVRLAAQKVVAGPEYARYETDIARAIKVAAEAQPPDTPAQLTQMADDSFALYAAVTRVADLGATDAKDAIRETMLSAQRRAQEVGVLAVLVLLGTALAVSMALSSVLRPLRALTRRADDLASGRLDGTPVVLGGRNEFAQLSSALESSASTLRQVREQAHAIAAGFLDSPCLDEPAPGHLGRLLHDSVEAVRAMASQLRHQADRDPLTGLLNRAALAELLEEQGPVPGRVLLYLDLDGFKSINDTQGHDDGDTVLRTVAARLLAEANPADLVVRLGGDEFVIVTTAQAAEPGHDLDEAHVLGLIERLRAAVAQPISFSGTSSAPGHLDQDSRHHRVGVSIGWTSFAGDDTMTSALIRADASMYVMKRAIATERASLR